MNHAPKNPVTAIHTRRRRRLISLGSGPAVAKPAAAAALDVPTAGVPTYLVASPPPAADVFAASGFGLAESVSGPAMRYLLDCWSSKIMGGSRKRRPLLPQVAGPLTPTWPGSKIDWSRIPNRFRNNCDLSAVRGRRLSRERRPLLPQVAGPLTPTWPGSKIDWSRIPNRFRNNCDLSAVRGRRLSP